MSPMYRKKPVIIEAQQWTGDNIIALWEWISAAHLYGPIPAEPATTDASGTYFAARLAQPARLYVAANSAWRNIAVGEWILKDSLGFYPCQDSVFCETYEQVTS